MKTPEEIKKGLECYIMQNTGGCEDIPCRDCPHYDPNSAYTITACKDALAYIKQLEANQPKWISVKEMFPKHKQVVLAYVDPCLEIVQWNEADGLWDADAGWFKLDSVTHWMPLPEPPEEDCNAY